MQSKSVLKFPNQLNLGTILPGHYGECLLPFQSQSVLFLSLELSQKSIDNGFFLLKEGTNDCKSELSLVVKPGKTTTVIIASYAREISKSSTFVGQLCIAQEAAVHTIKLSYRVEIPRILAKKMLEDTCTKEKMMRIIVNKAVTNQGRIMLTNLQDYPLELEAGLLVKASIADKNLPFLLKTQSEPISVQAKEQFIVFLTLTTNIGFKGEFKGMKKLVMRNVLTLKTNSVLIWCIPVELIVVWVKQPEIKE